MILYPSCRIKNLSTSEHRIKNLSISGLRIRIQYLDTESRINQCLDTGLGDYTSVKGQELINVWTPD